MATYWVRRVVSPFLSHFNPTFETSTPSIWILPDKSSTNQYRLAMIDDFPAPVLWEVSSKKASVLGDGRVPANDTNLLSWRNVHTQTFKHGGQLRMIFHEHIFRDTTAFKGPGRRRWAVLDLVRGFLFDLAGIVDNSLHSIHIILHLCDLMDHYSKGLEWQVSWLTSYRLMYAHTYCTIM